MSSFPQIQATLHFCNASKQQEAYMQPKYNKVREGLRVTLERLEQIPGLIEDAEAMAELKRLILLRISELDATEGIAHAALETPARIK